MIPSHRKRLARALKDHRYDSMSQDSGKHCICRSDSRFEQTWPNGRVDPPWETFEEHLVDVVEWTVGLLGSTGRRSA